MATTPTTPVAYQDVTITWATSLLTALAEKLLKEGDTMSGALTVSVSANPQVNVDGTVTSEIVFKVGGVSKGSLAATTSTLTLNIPTSGNTMKLQTNTVDRLTISDTGITHTVPCTLSAAPTADLHAASKLYVDSVAINAQTGTTYTLALTDQGKLVTLSNASAITLTVPLNSAVAFPIGTQIHLLQIGAGVVTVTQTGGVTVNATPSKVFRAQYSMATLIKYGTDTWVLVGDT